MSDYYILKGNKPVETDRETWSKFMEKSSVIIGRTTFPSGVWVSTVFLGIPHPQLFETMVFPAEDNFTELEGERYDTYGEAVIGHHRMVKKYWED